MPLFAISGALGALRGEIVERLSRALDSGRYILGEEALGFESEFAANLGARDCIGMNSGTDALTIGLRTLGVGRGDEVIVPAVSFAATAEAVVHAGARPVFADVEELRWRGATASFRSVAEKIDDASLATRVLNLEKRLSQAPKAF